MAYKLQTVVLSMYIYLNYEKERLLANKNYKLKYN